MGRPKSRDDKQLHTERVPMHMTKSEVEAIDDWRFARRIGSRSEAIRQLVALGLRHSAIEDAP